MRGTVSMSFRDFMKNFFGKNEEIDNKIEKLSKSLEEIQSMVDKEAKESSSVIVTDLEEIPVIQRVRVGNISKNKTRQASSIEVTEEITEENEIDH